MSKLTVGTKLTPETRRVVLMSYVHRTTIENTYARERNYFGASVKPITDQEWLEQHAFYTRNDGKLDARYHHCEPAILAE